MPANASGWPRPAPSIRERWRGRPHLARRVHPRPRRGGGASSPSRAGAAMSLGAHGGFQTDLPELLRIMPMDHAAQVDKFLARLAAVPQRVDAGAALAEARHRARLGAATRGAAARAGADRRTAAGTAERKPLARSAAAHGLARSRPPRRRHRASARLKRCAPRCCRRCSGCATSSPADYMAAAPADGALSGYPDGAAGLRAGDRRAHHAAAERAAAARHRPARGGAAAARDRGCLARRRLRRQLKRSGWNT